MRNIFKIIHVTSEDNVTVNSVHEKILSYLQEKYLVLGVVNLHPGLLVLEAQNPQLGLQFFDLCLELKLTVSVTLFL